MDKKISLTVEEWVALQEQSPDGAEQIPVWFQVTGSSMLPFVRPFRDNVMLVAVEEETLKVGDIVLFPGKYAGGDYCLHRLYRIEDDRVQCTQTIGNPRDRFWARHYSSSVDGSPSIVSRPDGRRCSGSGISYCPCALCCCYHSG